MSLGDQLVKAITDAIDMEDMSEIFPTKKYEEELLSGKEAIKRFKRLQHKDLQEIPSFQSDVDRHKSYQVRDIIEYIDRNKTYNE